MRTLLLAGALLVAQPALAADKLVASNVDTRTVLGFAAPAAAVQKLLPAGWEIDSPASGPPKGINLTILLIDSMLVVNAEGKSVPPTRAAVLGIPAKKTDTRAAGLMIVAGLAVDAGPGPYGVNARADITIERSARSQAGGAATIEESWTFKGEADAIQFQVQYTRGTPAQDKTELNVYSAIRPDFYRIYRYEQGADVVRGADATDRAQKVVFKASGPKLAPLFDGSEKLISIISIPWYLRQVYLPGS